MTRIIKLKNTTNADIVIFGWVLSSAGEYLTVDPIEYLEFSRNDYLFELIGNGSIVVNDGDKDLTVPTEGWRWILGNSNDLALHDGDTVVLNDTVDESILSNGVLISGINGDNLASPIRSNNNRELQTNDVEVIYLLNKILKELQKINIYNSMMHDHEIDNSELEDN